MENKVNQYIEEIRKNKGRKKSTYIPDDQKPEFISVKEAWALLEEHGIDVGLHVIYLWRKKFKLGKRYGGKVLIDKAKFEKFLKGDYKVEESKP